MKFVHLPSYEGLQSYRILKYGDFKDNYLLFISSFQLGKHYKTIENRIIKNFEKGNYIEDSLLMLSEICGFRNSNIFKLGTLFDIFSKIDYLKYKKEIFEIFCLQLFDVKFNKKRKYAKAYKLYKSFKVDFLELSKEDFEKLEGEEKSLLYIFYQALIYCYIRNATERLYRIDDLISALDKDNLLYLKHELDVSCEEFFKLVKSYEKNT